MAVRVSQGSQPDAGRGAQRGPSRRALWVITGVGLAVWFVFTVFAEDLVPIIIGVAEWVEALIGFDISGTREG